VSHAHTAKRIPGADINSTIQGTGHHSVVNTIAAAKINWLITKKK